MNKILSIIILVFLLIPGISFSQNLTHEKGLVLAKDIFSYTKTLMFKGIEMQESRLAGDLKSCGEEMRVNQKTARQIGAKAEQLSNEFLLVKLAASFPLEFCVSCLPDAINYCIDIGKALDEAKIEIDPESY